MFLRLVFRLWNDRFEHPIPGKLISARYGAPDRCRGYRILGTVTSPLEARDIRTTEGLPGSPLRLEQPGRYGAPFLRPASSGRGRASSRRTGVHEHRPGAASLHENDGISCGSLQARGRSSGSLTSRPGSTTTTSVARLQLTASPTSGSARRIRKRAAGTSPRSSTTGLPFTVIRAPPHDHTPSGVRSIIRDLGVTLLLRRPRTR